MRRLVLFAVGVAVAAALVLLLRRRTEQPPASAAVPMPEPAPPVDLDEPGAAPGPEARERESAVTDDTRFDRIAEQEREARRDAAQRLQSEPFTERLSGGESEEP